MAFPAAAGSGRLAADQQRAAAGRGIPCFSRNALTAAAQMKRRSSSNAAAATQWLWQQGSGTGSDSGCLGFASVTRAVEVAGVGVAAKETQQLTPQQLTQRSWPQFSIVRRGGSGAGRKGAAQRQQRTAAQGAGRAHRCIGSSGAAASGTAAQRQWQQQQRQRHSGQRQRRSGSGAAAAAQGGSSGSIGAAGSGSGAAAAAAAQRQQQRRSGSGAWGR